MKKLTTALVAISGIIAGALTANYLSSMKQSKSPVIIESLKIGGIVNVGSFKHDTDGYDGKCSTDVELIQNINIDENMNGSLEIMYRNKAETDYKIGYGYVKGGKGFVSVSSYDYSKKSCDYETVNDYGISKVLYATVKQNPLFVGEIKD